MAEYTVIRDGREPRAFTSEDFGHSPVRAFISAMNFTEKSIAEAKSLGEDYIISLTERLDRVVTVIILETPTKSWTRV
ncbi:MAG: hypothetical protein EOM24_31925 [Chloroflexia bacterium]|nr:hypothetical protein [Chloroflexia bacterium]